MRMQNLPRLGKGWMHLGLIRKVDKAYVIKAFEKQRIVYKLTSDTYHEKSDPKQKEYLELFVARGYRRDAMKLLKFIFRQQVGE